MICAVLPSTYPNSASCSRKASRSPEGFADSGASVSQPILGLRAVCPCEPAGVASEAINALIAERRFIRSRSASGYSITRSARSSVDGAKVKACALAVFLLITSWKLTGCWIGRSPGLAPLRIWST